MDVADLVAGMRHLLRFLAVGALAAALSASVRDDRELLVVSRERLADLEADWRRTTGAPPSGVERAELVEREIDDEILFREALRRGLERGSLLVRDRLLTTMRFLGEADASEEELVRGARELGLDRTDLVIRRHLVEDMRLRVRREGDDEPVTEAELEARLAGDRGAGTSRTALRHFFFDRERRGSNAEPEAKALAERLQRGAGDPVAARAGSDPFLHGLELPALSARELESRFGAEFVRAADALRAGEWSGPLRSPYGFHVVRLDERRNAAPDVAGARARIAHAIRLERGTAHERAQLREWRAEYRVVVEEASR